MGFRAPRARGHAACAPQHHTPPFSFPRKKTGGVTVQKKGTYIASEQLEELQCLPIALPARGVAALALLYDLPLLLLSAAALLIL